MKAKLFEIRDKATFIPVVAIKPDAEPNIEAERYLLSRSGYGTVEPRQAEYVLMSKNISGGIDIPLNYDPTVWNDRTYSIAHQYIIDHFDELESGAVIDVEFILGETESPKSSEALSA